MQYNTIQYNTIQYNRCEFEAVAIEIEPLVAELKFALKHIDEWARPVLTPSPALLQPSLSEYIYEPYGVW